MQEENTDTYYQEEELGSDELNLDFLDEEETTEENK